MTETYFLNRKEAGERLAQELAKFKDESVVVLALPRGGVPIGLEVARALGAPLDLVLVRKIGAPHLPELAIGAVVDGPHPFKVINDEVVKLLNVPEAYVRDETDRQLAEIERRREKYLRGRKRAAVEGQTVIVVDDGIATGATVRAGLQAVRMSRPAKLVLAVPVAPPETVEKLREEVDEVICLIAPEYFGSLSQFYLDFRQVADDDVVDLMDQSAPTASDETLQGNTSEERAPS